MKITKKERLCLGAHLSVAGGVSKAVEQAIELRTRCLQIFTKNASRWEQRGLDPREVERFLERWREWGKHPVVSHDSYLINVASPRRELRERSIRALADELDRARRLELDGVVMHPGAHLGLGVPKGVERVATALRRVLRRTPRGGPRILLENTAGQGTVLGSTFEELAAMLDRVDAPRRVGVCLDSCHLFAAGYDLSTPGGYRETMARLEATLGSERVRCWHLNDSRGDLGSHLDRHEHIGRGKIGRAGFRRILRDPRFFGIPKILETPKANAMDRVNLQVLSSM